MTSLTDTFKQHLDLVCEDKSQIQHYFEPNKIIIYIVGRLKDPAVLEMRNLLVDYGFPNVFSNWHAVGPNADDHWKTYYQKCNEVDNLTDLDLQKKAILAPETLNTCSFDQKILYKAHAVVVMPNPKNSACMEFGFSCGVQMCALKEFYSAVKQYSLNDDEKTLDPLRSTWNTACKRSFFPMCNPERWDVMVNLGQIFDDRDFSIMNDNYYVDSKELIDKLKKHQDFVFGNVDWVKKAIGKYGKNKSDLIQKNFDHLLNFLNFDENREKLDNSSDSSSSDSSSCDHTE